MQNFHPQQYNELENAIWQEKRYVCGIDEVGRGCLAGPVVVCALVLKQGTKKIFSDSKKLSEKKRIESALWLQNNSWYSISMCSPELIDRYNIYQATRIAMTKAINQLCISAPMITQNTSLIISDAVPIDLSFTPKKETLHYFFNKGEDYSASIAAASIMAKVYRDELMKKLGNSFPSYDWSSNKGYGTKTHRMTLHKQLDTFVHRKKFIETVLQRESSVTMNHAKAEGF